MYQARLGMLMTRESKFLVKVVTAVQNSEKSFMIEIQWFNSHWNSFQKCCGWKQEKLLITFLNSVPSWQVLNGLEAMGYKVGLKTLSLKKWKNILQNTTRWKMLKKRHRRKGKLIVIIQYILSGDLLRLLHDWGAAPWLSRVCLDFVQDKGRVGRVEQVKSWGSWAPFRILTTLFQPRQVDQVDLLVCFAIW